MTVAELIEALRDLPPGAEVNVDVDEDFCPLGVARESDPRGIVILGREPEPEPEPERPLPPMPFLTAKPPHQKWGHTVWSMTRPINRLGPGAVREEAWRRLAAFALEMQIFTEHAQATWRSGGHDHDFSLWTLYWGNLNVAADAAAIAVRVGAE